jgi:hypothetical protein
MDNNCNVTVYYGYKVVSNNIRDFFEINEDEIDDVFFSDNFPKNIDIVMTPEIVCHYSGGFDYVDKSEENSECCYIIGCRLNSGYTPKNDRTFRSPIKVPMPDKNHIMYLDNFIEKNPKFTDLERGIYCIYSN